VYIVDLLTVNSGTGCETVSVSRWQKQLTQTLTSVKLLQCFDFWCCLATGRLLESFVAATIPKNSRIICDKIYHLS